MPRRSAGRASSPSAARSRRASTRCSRAVMAYHYRDMVVLLFPPLRPTLQRLIFPALARLGERRGYRPGQFAEIEA